MRLDINGSTIGYDLWGEGETTLALLHAYPLSRGQWQAQGEALARALALRIVAPDLRGCGESSVGSEPLTMELDLLKKTPRLQLVSNNENSSIISGPKAAPSEGDAT